jgi:transitional endoplasmic reticulum ATPase
MSVSLEQKLRHERAAEEAISAGQLKQALGHCIEAARYGFSLADISAGPIAEAYVEDAEGLLGLAERLKTKIGASTAAPISTEAAPASDKPWRLLERPTIRLADVAGMEEVKRIIEEDVIKPARHPETYARFGVKPGSGVLMYGPPGNGKTHIAKAIAGELDAAFFNVDPAEIKSKWVGESEQNLARLFAEARAEKRAVIYFDEVDALLSRSGNQKVNIVTQFLMMTDGIMASLAANESLLLLAATNKPWLLDPAVRRPGRFGKLVYIGLPDLLAREAIIRQAFLRMPVVSNFPYLEGAVETDGFSGADVRALCDETARQVAARELRQGASQVIGWEDFRAARAKARPSVRLADLKPYQEWQAANGGDASPGIG